MEKTINITLKVWRQKGPKEKGRFEEYKLNGVSTDSSFLEMLDLLNEQLINEGKEPVVFDHDCREGICGMCSLYINGHPHGPDTSVTTCQLHMRKFNDGDVITFGRIPRYSRLDGRPSCIRQNTASRRIYLGKHGRCTRCQRNSHLQNRCRRGYGLGYLYRLRSLRSSL